MPNKTLCLQRPISAMAISRDYRNLRRRLKAYASQPPAMHLPIDSISDLFPTVTYCEVPGGAQPPGLAANLKAALLKELLPADAGSHGAVLVVEERSISLLEPVVKVNDLTRVGMPLIEKLEKSRQPLPSMPAVYLCEPTEENAELISADFEKKPNFYKAAHVFVTSEPMPAFKNALRRQRALRKKLLSLKVVKVDFACNAEQFYVLHPAPDGTEDAGVPDLVRFWGRYSTHMHRARSARRVGDGILNALAVLGDYPHVRFQKDSPTAELVAGEVIRGLERLYPHRQHAIGQQQVRDTTSPTLLVLDRTVDPVTPLLHFFTYEAMLYDLMPESAALRTRPRYSGAALEAVKPEDGRATALDSSDACWGSLRYEHFDVLRVRVQKELQAMKASRAAKVHPELRKSTGKQLSTAELQEGMQALPQFQRASRSLATHIELLTALQDGMRDGCVDAAAAAEQDFATGETPNTRNELQPLERRKAWKRLVALVDGGRDGLGTSQGAYERKLRLVLVFVMTQGGLHGEERDALRTALASEHPNEAGIDSFLSGAQHLGIASERDGTPQAATPWYKKLAHKLPGQQPPPNGKSQRRGSLDTAGDDAYLLSRAVPRVQGIAKALDHHIINHDEYPLMAPGGAGQAMYPPRPAGNAPREGVSQRTRRPSWAEAARQPVFQASAANPSANGAPPPTLRGPRLHIFIVGGVSPGELQAAAALQAETGREVLLGGSEMLTPHRFLEAIRALDEPVAGASRPAAC